MLDSLTLLTINSICLREGSERQNRERESGVSVVGGGVPIQKRWRLELSAQPFWFEKFENLEKKKITGHVGNVEGGANKITS